MLAYPYGFSNSTVERLAKEEGYLLGLGVEPGWNEPFASPDGLFQVKRFNISPREDLAAFREILEG